MTSQRSATPRLSLLLPGAAPTERGQAERGGALNFGRSEASPIASEAESRSTNFRWRWNARSMIAPLRARYVNGGRGAELRRVMPGAAATQRPALRVERRGGEQAGRGVEAASGIAMASTLGSLRGRHGRAQSPAAKPLQEAVRNLGFAVRGAPETPRLGPWEKLSPEEHHQCRAKDSECWVDGSRLSVSTIFQPDRLCGVEGNRDGRHMDHVPAVVGILLKVFTNPPLHLRIA